MILCNYKLIGQDTSASEYAGAYLSEEEFPQFSHDGVPPMNLGKIPHRNSVFPTFLEGLERKVQGGLVYGNQRNPRMDRWARSSCIK
jgi:hypothetical protein